MSFQKPNTSDLEREAPWSRDLFRMAARYRISLLVSWANKGVQFTPCRLWLIAKRKRLSPPPVRSGPLSSQPRAERPFEARRAEADQFKIGQLDRRAWGSVTIDRAYLSDMPQGERRFHLLALEDLANACATLAAWRFSEWTFLEAEGGQA